MIASINRLLTGNDYSTADHGTAPATHPNRNRRIYAEADKALYLAKKHGRNQVITSSPTEKNAHKRILARA